MNIRTRKSIKRFGSRPEGSRSPLPSISGYPALGLLLIRLLGDQLQYYRGAGEGQAAAWEIIYSNSFFELSPGKGLGL